MKNNKNILKDKTEYSELAKAKVSDSRNIVISSCSKGGFTIAQQLEVEENGKPTFVFMKGAYHIAGIDGLYSLRDAVTLAINYHEDPSYSGKKEDLHWDE